MNCYDVIPCFQPKNYCFAAKAYKDGMGRDVNPKLAKTMYRMAANLGCEDANKGIEKLEGEE